MWFSMVDLLPLVHMFRRHICTSYYIGLTVLFYSSSRWPHNRKWCLLFIFLFFAALLNLSIIMSPWKYSKHRNISLFFIPSYIVKKKDNRPKMESLGSSPTSANQDLILKLTAVSISQECHLYPSQQEITWSALKR